MSEIKVVKKSPQVETRIINAGSPFKRFAVVRVGGKSQQAFREWFDTYSEAEETATKYASDVRKGLYFILEVQAGFGQPGEFERKLPHIDRNHYLLVRERKALAAAAEERAAKQRHSSGDELDAQVEGFGVAV